MPMRPYTIRLYLPNGDPDGLRIIEKSNWTGKGVVFKRAMFQEAAGRDEFKRTGVYILVGPSEEGGLPIIYVGEGDPVADRLKGHNANKDFWTWCVFFVSKDEYLNKAIIQHLESRLVGLAREAKQAKLDNGNVPQPPTLSESDQADAESFLADILSILPLVGLPVFEGVKKTKGKKEPTLYLKGKGVEARGKETTQGFIVLKDSQMCRSEVPSIHPYMSTLRKDLEASGVIYPSGDHFHFVMDYTFNSPTTAAGVILGRTANGRTEWKLSDGTTLKELQTRNAGQSSPDQCE